MFPDKRDRWCVSLEDWGRYIFEVCQSAIGGTCWPEYQPTCVRAVEVQRESLGLALAGQLTVVSLRLLTGHVGEGAVALVVFAMGNRARCSLRASRLSAYIGFTFSLAVLDAAALVNSIGALGLDFFTLPLQAHLSQNLTSISMMISPVAETCGGFAAWECLSRPGLILMPGQDTAPVNPHPNNVPRYTAGGWQRQQALSWPGHRGHWPSEASMAGGRAGQVAWPEEALWPAKAEAWCAECGRGVSARDGWRGTGPFQDKVYCKWCWASWTQADRIG